MELSGAGTLGAAPVSPSKGGPARIESGSAPQGELIEMTGKAAAPRPKADAHPPTLAQRGFPRRVRSILEGVLQYASDEMERGLGSMLNETEQHLFKLAEQARSNEVQKQCLEALSEVRMKRADFVPRFVMELEAALARLHDPVTPKAQAFSSLNYSELSLVENVAMDEDIVLNEVAARTEMRNSLTLFLLGQRFGVIAGRPAFDAEHLPIGPTALCRVLREATHCFDLNSEHRQLLFRQFDRLVLQFLSPFFEMVNNYLIKEKVLPHLTFVPVRSKPSAQPTNFAAEPNKAAARAERRAPATVDPAVPASKQPPAPRSETAAAAARQPPANAGGDQHAPRPSGGPAAPLTGWPGQRPEVAPAGDPQDQEMFDVLRQLLAGRRSLLGKLGGSAPAAPKANSFTPRTEDLQSVLGMLQQRSPAPVMLEGKPVTRSVAHLKHDLLAQLRQLAPDGKAPALAEKDADSIDLVGMLFDHILRDVRPNSPAAALLTKLQVPLLRVALDDKGFFTQRQHPARQMLNAIAETGAYWVSDEQADRDLIDKMRMLVDRVASEFSGDNALFESMLGDLSQHMQLQARKAEVAERRHVDAARGKEKLEIARIRAAEAIDEKLRGKRIPKFLHSLLAQAWSDVLSLTMLRQGEDSDAFRHQLQIVERLIESAVSLRTTGKSLIGPAEVQSLRAEIEQSLTQVGYHSEDAQSVAMRLLASSLDEDESDPASRTELAMRLKSRTRLGQNVESQDSKGDKLIPLDAEEQSALERIKHLPYGTWFEFTINQQGDKSRRRMSWFSPTTGHTLFVNHRGQRIGEYPLVWLARELKRGNVRVIETSSDSMIDRAWSAILGALKTFSGRGESSTSST